MKRRLHALCAIVGYLSQEGGDIRSLVVAMERDGMLAESALATARMSGCIWPRCCASA